MPVHLSPCRVGGLAAVILAASAGTPALSQEPGAPLAGQVWHLDIEQAIGAYRESATLALTFDSNGCIEVIPVTVPDDYQPNDMPCASQFAVTGTDSETPDVIDVAFAYEFSYPVWSVIEVMGPERGQVRAETASRQQTCEGFRLLEVGEQAPGPVCGLPELTTGSSETSMRTTVTRTR